MRCSRTLRFVFFPVLCLFFCLSVRAQADPAFDVGVKPFGSYSAGNIDHVDLASGNLNVSFPIISYPQRGGKLNFTFYFYYQSGPATSTEHCNSDGTICTAKLTQYM